MPETIVHDLFDDVSDQLHMDKLQAEVVLEGILYDEYVEDEHHLLI